MQKCDLTHANNHCYYFGKKSRHDFITGNGVFVCGIAFLFFFLNFP